MTETIEYDGEGVSVTAELRAIPGSHLWDGTYSIWTAEGSDGAHDLGQDERGELEERVAAIAREHGIQ